MQPVLSELRALRSLARRGTFTVIAALTLASRTATPRRCHPYYVRLPSRRSGSSAFTLVGAGAPTRVGVALV